MQASGHARADVPVAPRVSDPVAAKRRAVHDLLVARGKDFPGLEHDLASQPEDTLDELLRFYGGSFGVIW